MWVCVCVCVGGGVKGIGPKALSQKAETGAPLTAKINRKPNKPLATNENLEGNERTLVREKARPCMNCSGGNVQVNTLAA